jgi:hypothetical protein
MQIAIDGMNKALAAKPEWSKLADQWLSELPEGTRFTSEDLTYSIGYPAGDNLGNANNAVGAKIRTWGNAGLTYRSGYTQSNNLRSHGRMIAEWTKI